MLIMLFPEIKMSSNPVFSNFCS